MKNKKLYTRLFALLASLVLVFALALPCFADTVESEPFVVKTISFTDLDSLSQWLSVNHSSVFEVRDPYSRFLQFNYYGDIVEFTGTVVISVGGNVFEQFTENIRIIFTDSSITRSLFNYQVQTSTQYFDFSSSSVAIENISQYVFYYYAPIDNGSSTDPTTPSSDMYSNLFNILKDAVYGSDAELTGSQEYALTLISTILTYATILLPVILVIFIAVWCFKRF